MGITKVDGSNNNQNYKQVAVPVATAKKVVPTAPTQAPKATAKTTQPSIVAQQAALLQPDVKKYIEDGNTMSEAMKYTKS